MKTSKYFLLNAITISIIISFPPNIYASNIKILELEKHVINLINEIIKPKPIEDQKAKEKISKFNGMLYKYLGQLLSKDLITRETYNTCCSYVDDLQYLCDLPDVRVDKIRIEHTMKKLIRYFDLQKHSQQNPNISLVGFFKIYNELLENSWFRISAGIFGSLDQNLEYTPSKTNSLNIYENEAVTPYSFNSIKITAPILGVMTGFDFSKFKAALYIALYESKKAKESIQIHNGSGGLYGYYGDIDVILTRTKQFKCFCDYFIIGKRINSILRVGLGAGVSYTDITSQLEGVKYYYPFLGATEYEARSANNTSAIDVEEKHEKISLSFRTSIERSLTSNISIGLNTEFFEYPLKADKDQKKKLALLPSVQVFICRTF